MRRTGKVWRTGPKDSQPVCDNTINPFNWSHVKHFWTSPVVHVTVAQLNQGRIKRAFVLSFLFSGLLRSGYERICSISSTQVWERTRNASPSHTARLLQTTPLSMSLGNRNQASPEWLPERFPRAQQPKQTSNKPIRPHRTFENAL
jgi:hypothetical protein